MAGGRYQLRRLLGEGARKRVYLGHDPRLGRDVAVALVKTDGLDEAALARVQREARAMGALGDHPNVVTVHDIGEEDGQPYIVSQYMGGGSVDDLLKRAPDRRLPLEQALRIADHVSQALEHAHHHGVIHRDVKPGNIWLTRDGTAKLGDFGLATARDRSRLTLEGMMVGTVAYMAPEQALGRDPDARSDLYALGATLFEMLTGRPPFLGDDAVAIVSQHINTAPVAPSWYNPEVPRALESLIMRLLAKLPEERPETAATVRQALAAIAAAPAGSADPVAREEANPLDRLAGGVFVGREEEMDRMRAALEEALSGRGRLLMLVGEPGIGKTRIADELGTYARLRKAQVLWGRCYESEGVPAYWPWVQAIRSYVHDRDPKTLLSEMGSGAVDIGQIVPDVRDRLPGLPAPAPVEAEQARFQLFDAVTTFLRNASRAQPLVLVLDDLHWADKSSLLLLQFLAREMRDARLLVIGTYRDIELRRQHPLSQALGELTRERLSERILLRGLTERDVGRFIEMTAALRPPQTLVDAVYRETEGNPFFVNEVVRLLVADGRLQRLEETKSWSLDIPQGVREVIGRRLDRLSAECNGVLTVASVIGREFGLDVLERVSDLPADRLLEVLEEALGARVVTEVPRAVGRYAFSHALVCETLYEELSGVRRVRLHRRIGEALEGLYGPKPEPHVAELAHHFFKASEGGQDVDKAIDYAVRAGDRANSLVAYEEAVGHYERALQALEAKDHPDDAQRWELLLAAGAAQRRAGDRARARETFQQAAVVARRSGFAERLARAALGFAPGFFETEVFVCDQSLVALLEEALAGLGDVETALRARLLSRLVMALYWSDQVERRASLGELALEVARRVGDPAALAHALAAKRLTLWEARTLDDRLALGREILRLAAETGELELGLEQQFFQITALLQRGDIAGADREIEAFIHAVEELRQPRCAWYPPMLKAMRTIVDGRFAEAERLALEALTMGQRFHDPNAVQAFGLQMGMIRWLQGRAAEVEPTVRKFSEQLPKVLAWRCGLAWVLSEIGRTAEAQRELDALASKDFADLPRDQTWFACVALLAEACAALGDARRAAILYDFLLPYEGHCTVGVYAVVFYGSADRSLGLLAATVSRFEEAARHFEQAIETNRRVGLTSLLADAQYRCARVLVARGERARALGLLNEALDTARALGMKGILEKALALKLEAQGVAASKGRTSIDKVASAVEREPLDLRPHAAPDGTVTVLFSDIEGSTAMTERLGDRRAQEVLRAHNAIVREQVRAHGGFEVKSQGDGFMIAFQSARRALLCAVALQRAFAAYAEQHPEEPIRVRIGLHTGEAIREADDFFGRHVILAARIAGEARGGEILVSSLLKELTESAGDINFVDRREVELKGLAGKQAVYAISWAPPGGA